MFNVKYTVVQFIPEYTLIGKQNRKGPSSVKHFTAIGAFIVYCAYGVCPCIFPSSCISSLIHLWCCLLDIRGCKDFHLILFRHWAVCHHSP